MLYFAPWKKFLILGICLLGIVFTLPNIWYEDADSAARATAALEAERYREAPQFADASPEEKAKLPTRAELEADAARWPSWAPPNVVNLGLDLRGGVHLLVEVQVQEVFAERLKNLRREVFDALRKERIARKITVSADHVDVLIADPADRERAGPMLEALARPVSGGIGGGFGMGGTVGGGQDIAVLPIEGGYRITLSEAGRSEIIERTMAQSLEIMRRRIDETGTREPTIQRQGDTRILIQVPGLGSSEELLRIIGKTAKLTFHAV